MAVVEDERVAVDDAVDAVYVLGVSEGESYYAYEKQCCETLNFSDFHRGALIAYYKARFSIL
jgi:hypothetical protein